MKTKDCVKCGKQIVKTYETILDWEKRQWCSFACRRGSKRPQEVKDRISATCKSVGVGKWMEGRERPVELRIKHSKAMKEWVASGTHNFWKGGISKLTRDFKANFQNTIEYRLWRSAVFQRDNYTCQECKARNGNGKRVVLNADHIKPFATHPQLRLAIDNGRTLCRSCHYKRHSKVGLPSQSLKK